jgi:choline monooxygenase
MSKEKNFFEIKKSKNTNTIFGLPAKFYTDKSFWEKECETVLSNDWLFVGFAHELKNIGDAIPLFIANKPILLVRNNYNEIKAFHNVFSHRCLKLIDHKKNVGKIIRCPYHAWSYDLDGNLKAAPHVGGTEQHRPKGFNFLEYGLKPIKIHIWHDWIFVNFNGKAKKFAKYAEPLISKLNDIDFSKLKYVTTLDFGNINTNWKFLYECDEKCIIFYAAYPHDWKQQAGITFVPGIDPEDMPQ